MIHKKFTAGEIGSYHPLGCIQLFLGNLSLHTADDVARGMHTLSANASRESTSVCLKGTVFGGPMDLGEMMAILQGGSPHTIVLNGVK